MKTKSMIRKQVNSRVNEVFISIIKDIPNPKFRVEGEEGYLKQVDKNGLISYQEFYDIIFMCFLLYNSIKEKDSMRNAIANIPRLITNIKRINCNKKILNLQHKILYTYFDNQNGNNIKDKVKELKTQIDEIIENDEEHATESDKMLYINGALDGFKNSINYGLIKDLNQLSSLLNEREDLLKKKRNMLNGKMLGEQKLIE